MQVFNIELKRIFINTLQKHMTIPTKENHMISLVLHLGYSRTSF